MAATLASMLEEVVQTKTASDEFAIQLDEIIDELFGSTNSFESLCEKKLSLSKKETVLQILLFQRIPLNDKARIKQSIEEIKQTLLQMPVLRLTLAFEARTETITMLRNWSYKSFGILPLLDISYDPSLLGGCILTFDGYYKDYSVKKVFQEKQQYILDHA